MQMASVVLELLLACFLFYSFLASVIGLTSGKNGSIKLRSRFGSEAHSLLFSVTKAAIAIN
jgi:hypothetical protein